MGVRDLPRRRRAAPRAPAAPRTPPASPRSPSTSRRARRPPTAPRADRSTSPAAAGWASSSARPVPALAQRGPGSATSARPRRRSAARPRPRPTSSDQRHRLAQVVDARGRGGRGSARHPASIRWAPAPIRQVAEDRGVAPLAERPLAGRLELLPGVLADERMAAEQRLAVLGRHDPQQALVDERDEAVEGRRARGVRVGVGDPLGRLGRPVADEDRQPAEEGLLVGLEQVVAPGDRAAERPLAFGQVARAARRGGRASGRAARGSGSAGRPGPGPPRARWRAAGPRAGGRCRRPPAGLGAGRLEVGPDQAGPVEEQRLGLRRAERRHLVLLLAG